MFVHAPSGPSLGRMIKLGLIAGALGLYGTAGLVMRRAAGIAPAKLPRGGRHQCKCRGGPDIRVVGSGTNVGEDCEVSCRRCNANLNPDIDDKPRCSVPVTEWTD